MSQLVKNPKEANRIRLDSYDKKFYKNKKEIEDQVVKNTLGLMRIVGNKNKSRR